MCTLFNAFCIQNQWGGTMMMLLAEKAPMGRWSVTCYDKRKTYIKKSLTTMDSSLVLTSQSNAFSNSTGATIWFAFYPLEFCHIPQAIPTQNANYIHHGTIYSKNRLYELILTDSLPSNLKISRFSVCYVLRTRQQIWQSIIHFHTTFFFFAWMH